ncbi:DinB family protein [Sebaldella sp. S0638]|uniref:DinB family protein n=1 Tax=Sebaldella sp. S0638 TaxID=2957809 RepID=UPI00209DFA41|nr:DinB family protein [Sebaldella sp. S0638]MCP1223140.1 DinB family protein [Sebaldella sp. S0638]
MFSVNNDWNPKQARLRSIIKKEGDFQEAMDICLSLHSIVHMPEVSENGEYSFLEEVLTDVSDDGFKNYSSSYKGRTMAYNIWHITRIEDICANILIAGGDQVINTDNWLKKSGSIITDTGNALTAEEIAEFSKAINKEELMNYRAAVGKKTREIIRNLTYKDMKRKMDEDALQRILDEKSVSEKEEAVWLVEFWGKKTVAGLLLLPITRHHVMHINDCLKIKKKIK